MPILDVHTSILVYGDGEFATNNPQRRYVDWARHSTAISVEKPTTKDYVLLPGEELSLFSGSRTTAIDGTSEFEITLNPVKSGVYRVSHTGGTAPAFRTKRSLDLTSEELTISINNNATAKLELDDSSLLTFGAVQVGDWMFVPNVSTGDGASSFGPNNGGFWVVLAKASKALTLRRRVGEDFVGSAEVVTPVDADEIQFFSAAGIQVGDSLEVSAGFSSISFKTFVVSEVSHDWVEFLSTEALPLETDVIPTAAGMTFYSETKRFVRVEVDQDAVLRLNGDTGNSLRLSPRIIGDPEGVAHFEKWGPCWDLKVVNRSGTAPMTVSLVAVE